METEKCGSCLEAGLRCAVSERAAFFGVLCAVVGVLAVVGPGLARRVEAQAGARKTVLEQLQEMREANRKLLERQGETLKKLEEVEKQASQLKMMSRRG